jgi:hypothetical protein
MENTFIQTIEKESITGLRFVKQSSVTDLDLESILTSARRLGNEFKGKVRIVFQTEDGLKQTETTIWGFTPEYIQLKGAVYIPIESIVSINF